MKEEYLNFFENVCREDTFLDRSQSHKVKMLLLEGDLDLSDKEIDFIERASPTQLCQWLRATQLKQTSECVNPNEMLSFDAVKEIPLLLLYILEDSSSSTDNRRYCFNIVFLHELITRPGAVNPYTQIPLTNKQKRAIKRRYHFVEDLMSILMTD